MSDKEDRGFVAARGAAANDDSGAEARIEAAVLTLARLIGRRIAREHHEWLQAANDNMPVRKTGDRRET